MQQPSLIIIAGCNGSGKSTYSKILVDDSIIPFDYDKNFLECYNQLFDSELREEIAINRTTEKLENLISHAFTYLNSFCFETNFVNFPIGWVTKAKSLGYKIEIYFFCLMSIEKAIERVMIRVKNDGHYVENHVIEYKWKEGYKTVNANFQLADYLLFIDNSNDASIPMPLFELIKIEDNKFEVVQICNPLPEYTQRRLPNIFELLS
jgi:predicted ABC-type ATPase